MRALPPLRQAGAGTHFVTPLQRIQGIQRVRKY
jgi:hypothetical protein